MFSFPPKSDEELDSFSSFSLLPEGIYPFVVKEVTPKLSKEGNNMLELRLAVLAQDGSERMIRDFLLADKMAFKLKHFCEAINFVEEYKRGYFDPQALLNKAGKVKIIIDKGKPKNDGSGFYPDKNAVKDYVKAVPVGQVVDPKLNDDIPF